MPSYVPVDYDPFAAQAAPPPPPPQYVPVDHDPFAAPRRMSIASVDGMGNPTGATEEIDAPPSQPLTGFGKYADDMTKSAGAGLVKGVAGLAGTPDMAADLIVHGVHKLEQKFSGETDDQLAQRLAEQRKHVMFPSVSDAISTKGITSAIENNVTGPLYEPETLPGKFVGKAAEFVPGGALGKLPNIVRNAVTYGVIPGLASEAAGQATEGSSLEPYARTTAAVLAGGGSAVAQRLGSAERLVKTATEGMTPAQLDQMEALMQEAQRQGIPLSRAEAAQHVTNGATGLGDLQRVVEGTGGMKDFYAGRPAQNDAAARRSFDTIAPAPADPSNIGPAVGREAEGLVTDVRGAINQATRPMYDASAGTLIPPQVHAAMIADPLFSDALDAVRNNPAKNSFVRNQSDRSIAAYDAVAKELEERARNASAPTNPEASQAVSSATGTLGGDVKDIAVAADRAATNGPSSYQAALANQSRLRDRYLQPLLNGPIGKIAAKDTTTKEAVNALFPVAPLANSEHEIAMTMTMLAHRNPDAARQLVRAHAEGVFNEASQNLAGGPNQRGAANFAAALRGNPQQAANLEASIRALPRGDAIWDGFDRLLDVMQAQGRRPAVNSATSFNTQILGDLKGGGIANNAAQLVAGGGVKLPQKTMDALQRWNIGRNLDQLSSLFTAPEAAQRFRQLALAPAGSTQAVSSILRLTNLARDHRDINNPLRASSGDKGN